MEVVQQYLKSLNLFCDEFIEYLNKNTVGTIKLTAIDSSKNASDEFVQTIKINDTTSPSILVEQTIEIKDIEIDKFKISDYLNISDNYDQNPVITKASNKKLEKKILGYEFSNRRGQEGINIYKDEEGNIIMDEKVYTRNTESNGRFHTDWLNMIYPRLKVARDLLSEDGVVFISIDENEVENLKKICNEIYGERNAVGTFIWRKKDGGGQAKDAFVIEHEYILVYKKSDLFIWFDKVEARSACEYNKSDDNGIYKITKLAKWGNTARREDRPSMYFPIEAPDETLVFPVAPDGGDGRWRVGKPRMNEIINSNLIHWELKNGNWIPYEKEYFANQSKVIKERSGYNE